MMFYQNKLFDLYQIEVVNDAMFWASNLYDAWCDSSEEINLHLIKELQKVINQLNTKDNNNTADNINEI